MLDLFLMILFCVRLFRRCVQAGVRSTWHIARLVGYWILSEILGMFLFMQIGFDVLLAALCAIALGVVAGVLSYQKSMTEINMTKEPGGDEPPRLNE